MDPFARIVVGYHGCTEAFAKELLLGKKPINEGEPVYPTAGFCHESHIQLAVRNSACILGVFRPNIEV